MENTELKDKDVYSTDETFIGRIIKQNQNTVDIFVPEWQTKTAIGRNLMIRFDKSYLKTDNEKIILLQKSPEDKEIWGKII